MARQNVALEPPQRTWGVDGREWLRADGPRVCLFRHRKGIRRPVPFEARRRPGAPQWAAVPQGRGLGRSQRNPLDRRAWHPAPAAPPSTFAYRPTARRPRVDSSSVCTESGWRYREFAVADDGLRAVIVVRAARSSRTTRSSVDSAEVVGNTLARPELERVRADVRAGVVCKHYLYRLDRLTPSGVRGHARGRRGAARATAGQQPDRSVHSEQRSSDGCYLVVAAALRITGGFALTAVLRSCSAFFAGSSLTGGSGFPFANAAFAPYFATILFFVSSPVASMTKFGTRRARLSATHRVISPVRRDERPGRLPSSARMRASTAELNARWSEGRTRATTARTASSMTALID